MCIYKTINLIHKCTHYLSTHLGGRYIADPTRCAMHEHAGVEWLEYTSTAHESGVEYCQKRCW